MVRGKRVVDKTRASIKQSLLKLIHKKNYPQIKVSEITAQANVGRSTFYTHYKSKADVLVDIHADIFSSLFSGLNSKEDWTQAAPRPELALFFERLDRHGRNPFSLTYKLGSDLDYLITSIELQLTKQVQISLQRSFSAEDFIIPLQVLAHSVSSLYSGLIMAWFTRFQTIDSKQFAGYIHRMAGALIQQSLVTVDRRNDYI